MMNGFALPRIVPQDSFISPTIVANNLAIGIIDAQPAILLDGERAPLISIMHCSKEEQTYCGQCTFGNGDNRGVRQGWFDKNSPGDEPLSYWCARVLEPRGLAYSDQDGCYKAIGCSRCTTDPTRFCGPKESWTPVGGWAKYNGGSKDFCRQYANTSIDQNRLNTSRRCGFSGNRWQSNYDHHFNWCRGVLPYKSDRETAARRNQLNGCP